MKTNPTRKSAVKAWCVLDSKGLMFAETTKPQAAVYQGSGRVAMGRDVYIVPCTITFTKPKKV